MAAEPLTEIDSRERAQAVRDLHDIVIHRVSEVRVHAAALQTVAGERGRASLDAILTASGQALQELRRMHQVIDPEHTISYAPQPDLDTLQDLLDGERPRMLPAVRRPGSLVPAGVAAGCYRVAQEVLRAVHQASGVRLDGAALDVGPELVLRLELSGGAAALDLRRAQVRAALLGGRVTRSGAGVRIRLPLEAQP